MDWALARIVERSPHCGHVPRWLSPPRRPDDCTRRFSPLLPTLVLLLTGALLLSAATPAAARSYTVWSTFLTVDEDGTEKGCDEDNSDLDDCDVGLASHEFAYEVGSFYAVETLVLYVDAMSNPKLELDLDENAPSDAPLALYLDGNRFAFGDATISGQKVTWSNPGITWTDNQVVTVSLVWEGPFGASPGKPTLTAVTSGMNAPTDTTLSFTITCVSGGKALVTDFAFYAVNDSDSSDTRTWNYSPVPLTCQDSSASITVTMPGFPSRTTATAYSVRARARNRLGSRGQWSNTAAATTTANNQQVSGGGTSDPEQEGDPLTASFEKVPAKHDGESAFTLQVRLSETVGKFSRSPRASSFAVTQGRVLSVEQVGAGLWQVKVQPMSSSDVTVTLEGGRDCDDEPSGAVCTKDVRALSNTLTVTIGGPTLQPKEEPAEEEPAQQQSTEPLTAAFANVPSEHDGTAFTFALTLSDTPGAGTLPVAASFRVAPGTASVSGSGTRYTVTVTPKRANAWKDVSITLLQPADCAVAGAVCTADGRALSNRASATVGGPVRIRIEGARAREGRDANLDFAVTLNRAASQAVSVDYATQDDTATAGADYTATSGMLTFAAGETAKTVSVPVLDDALDEGKEVMRLLLSNPHGAYLRKKHERARGLIVNDDPLQRAWLSRFGRTVAGHVTDAVGDRLRGAPGQDAHVIIGGYRLPLGRPAARQPAPDEATPGTEPRGTGTGAAPATAVLTEVARMLGLGPGAAAGPATPWAAQRDPRLGQGRALPTFRLREVLQGSAFRLNLGATDEDAAMPRLTAWGRVAGTTFDGQEGRLALNGDVLTGTVGLDGQWNRLVLGLAVAHSRGDGGVTQPNLAERGTGDLEQTLTSLHPYLRYAVTDRLDVWGLVGYGWGELDLEMANGVTVETDTTLLMGAFGGRGILVAPAETGGFQLATRTDAMLTRTSSDAVANSAATDADAHRLRVLLEGSRGVTWADGRSLTPTVELGVRHDWGDAETGFGLEVGGRVQYTDPTLGLTVEGTVRGLLAHEADAYKEWGASGSVRLAPGPAGHGLSVTLAPTWGAAASGVEGLWSRQTTQGLAPATPSAPRGRLAADVGYGVAAFGAGLLTPYAGTVLSAGADRTYRVGTRVRMTGLTLNLEGIRQAPAGQPVNQGLRLQVEWGF